MRLLIRMQPVAKLAQLARASPLSVGCASELTGKTISTRRERSVDVEGRTKRPQVEYPLSSC